MRALALVVALCTLWAPGRAAALDWSVGGGARGALSGPLTLRPLAFAEVMVEVQRRWGLSLELEGGGGPGPQSAVESWTTWGTARAGLVTWETVGPVQLRGRAALGGEMRGVRYLIGPELAAVGTGWAFEAQLEVRALVPTPVGRVGLSVGLGLQGVGHDLRIALVWAPRRE